MEENPHLFSNEEETSIRKFFSRHETASGIYGYLHEDLVVFLDVSGQKEALMTLIEKLDKEGNLIDQQAFFKAIIEREKIVSTGIGIGVAIPHAKLSGYRDFFIAIGIQQKGSGIEWHALDGLPVRIIFMIGGPDHKQAEYLNILSMITTAIKDEKRRKALLKASTAAEVIALFEGI